MWRLLYFLFFIVLVVNSYAQDERYFRKVFSGEFLHEKDIVEPTKYSYILHTPEYLLDLNDDGKQERIVYVKRDSEDWIEIFDKDKEKIFSYKFESKGFSSYPYRIVLKKISDKTKALLISYYEGETNYIESETSARVYLITIDNKDLKSLKIFKGPSMYEEFKSFKSHYHLRNYQYDLVDLNNDGVKELIVRQRGQSLVYLYEIDGKWKTFNIN